MTGRLARLRAAAPADTWFFLSVSAFALFLAVVYWFWTYDVAGTVLLVGFGIATGLMGVRLLTARPPLRRPEGETGIAAAGAGAPASPAAGAGATAAASAPEAAAETAMPAQAVGGTDATSSDAPDPDRPFLDESGRLPAPTIAPLAVGLALALVATSIVLGPWLLIAAILPLAWGALTWVRDAGAEFRAVAAEPPRAEVEARSGAGHSAEGEVPGGPGPSASSAAGAEPRLLDGSQSGSS